MSDQFQKLTAKLSELFELEKADLDFGIHRIIKARQQHIRIFLGIDPPAEDDPAAPTLKKIVRREMGVLNTADLQRQLQASEENIKEEFGKRAFDQSGRLTDGAAIDTSEGQSYLSLFDQLSTSAEESNAQLEAEIYSHLTTFFSRYYDEADFISKRRIKAGAEPYAIPYSGEEVMLHWANKDQYYIKSSKDLKDYTFTLVTKSGEKRVQFKCERQDPVLNNNNAKREFHLDDEAQIEITENTLVIPFHFRIVEKTRTQPEQKTWIASILTQLPLEWQSDLQKIPDGSKNNLITRHLNNYTRKNEADFFIHKHLSKFLNGELDFYIKNEVMHLDDIDTKSPDYLSAQVRKIKAIRNIARHLITFLAQLENFQKKIWLKKKTVTETHYCFTLDRLFALENSAEIIEKILAGLDHKIRRYDGEMRSQHDEWIKLYAIDELADYPADGKLTEKFLRAHDKLMLDTVFYGQALQYQILAQIPDIDSSLDGLLIHSENFQALNLLQERYREKVKCVYIDPPYNTSENTFIYKNQYKHSSWLSMIANGIGITRGIMHDSAVLMAAIDDTESARLRFLLEIQFLESNFLGTIAVEVNPAGQNIRPNVPARSHDYFHIYAKHIEDSSMILRSLTSDEIKQYKEKDSEGRFYWDNLRRRGGNSRPTDRPKQWYPIFVEGMKLRIPQMNYDEPKKSWILQESPKGSEVVIWPIDPKGEKRIWRSNPAGTQERIERGEISVIEKAGRQEISLKSREPEGRKPKTLWSDSKYSATSYGTKFIIDILGNGHHFSYPKSIHLTQDAIGYWAEPNSITIDFFAGSGTTGHAIINLNRIDSEMRKYILVEMGDHFDTVLMPRIQKVVYSADWKDGKPVTSTKGASVAEGELKLEDDEEPIQTGINGVSHAFKYLRLESYEDALNNLDLGRDRSADLLGLGDQVRVEYLFSYLLDVETRGHLMNLDRFRDPWACQLKIHDPHSSKSEPRNIDLIETFSYLIGLTVRELRVRDGFLTLEGENPEGNTILIIWRKTSEDGSSDWQATSEAQLRAFAKDKLRLNPADTEYHAIYLNGDHTLEDPLSKIHCTEEIFYQRLFEHTGNPDD